MSVQQRINLMVQLGQYMLSDDNEWLAAKQQAYAKNPWFIPTFIDAATQNIATHLLNFTALATWAQQYNIADIPQAPKQVGIVMAGNLPLVGFHDFLCVYISGHTAVIKLSSKDDVLLKHLVKKLYEWEVTVQNQVAFAEQLKGCDAYIATGSNNSSRYFDYYFGKYPNIIRRNRTSIAVLDGTETAAELNALANDLMLYFGQGCRNVTQLYLPQGYTFEYLLQHTATWQHLIEHHKYKNNYDYQLALLLMNSKPYMTNGLYLLHESEQLFAAISVVNYAYYTDENALRQMLAQHGNNVQCIVGKSYLPFGTCQQPSLTDYADGVDTMAWLTAL
jgi:hypothetical protein